MPFAHTPRTDAHALPRSAQMATGELDTVFGTGSWKPPEPAVKLAALRSAGFQPAGSGGFQLPVRSPLKHRVKRHPMATVGTGLATAKAEVLTTKTEG